MSSVVIDKLSEAQLLGAYRSEHIEKQLWPGDNDTINTESS